MKTTTTETDNGLVERTGGWRNIHVVPRRTAVEIGGQQYPILTTYDAQYVTKLAGYVDQKMRAEMDAAPTSDKLTMAVRAALHIADEFFYANRGREQGR